MIDQGYSVQSGCGYFDKSRQGYYYQHHSESARLQLRETIISEVNSIRRDLPRSGGRKLQYILKDIAWQAAHLNGKVWPVRTDSSRRTGNQV